MGKTANFSITFLQLKVWAEASDGEAVFIREFTLSRHDDFIDDSQNEGPGSHKSEDSWCRNPGARRQPPEGVSTAEEKAIKTLVHLHLAGWRELQAAFQHTEKHWKQLEEQQVATHQMASCWWSDNLWCAWGQEPHLTHSQASSPRSKEDWSPSFPSHPCSEGARSSIPLPSHPYAEGSRSPVPLPPIPAPRRLRAHFLSPLLTAVEGASAGPHPMMSRQACLHPKKSL
ncbi:hypothetical protein AOLI_G00110430 [Acnodon oligacanthus]